MIPPINERRVGFSSFMAMDMGITTSGVMAIIGKTTPVELSNSAHW
jgi:hypothetical protein